MPTKPRVLLTNDDGPPSAKESPYIMGLYLHLTQQLGWDVKVVLPSSQKSWIGKAYHIKEITNGCYYYPRMDGGEPETCESSRKLKEGEIAEWILLDGTPATCANVALHNLFSQEIDLVISGPNFGRNTSSAFALSSGTIGAALSASLSGVRAIAVSYGTMGPRTPPTLFEPAHRMSVQIVSHLWDNWGRDTGGNREGEVDLYSVNIPLLEQLLEPEGLTICWTSMWRNSYRRLFKTIPRTEPKHTQTIDPAGPNSLTTRGKEDGVVQDVPQSSSPLRFKFSPDMASLINPSISTLPIGSDGWAMYKGWASVTPLRASFGEPSHEFDDTDPESRVWRMKL